MQYNKPEDAQPDAIMPSEPPISLDVAKRRFTDAMRATSQNNERCKRDHKYYHGLQISPQDKDTLSKRGQPPIVVNMVKPAINGLLGMFDASESDPQAYPRNPGDENAADTVTKLLRFLADKAELNDKLRILSDNFFIEGTCAATVCDGMQSDDKYVCVEPILWEDFFYDPTSRYHDFCDARYLGAATWMEAEEVASKYPETYAKLGKPQDTGLGDWIDKSDFEQRNIWLHPLDRKRLRVVEMYLRDGNNQWTRVVFCSRGFLDHGPSAHKDDEGNSICPIVAVSFAVNRQNGDRYGALRALVDLQDEVNARRSRALHLTNNRQVQVTSPDANPVHKSEAKKQASRADGVMPFGYEVRPAPDMAEGNIAMMQQSIQDINRMIPTPATLSRFGSGDSGRAREILQNAGMTEWSRAFAMLEQLHKRILRHMWFGARRVLPDNFAIRITGDYRTPEFEQVNIPKLGLIHQPATGPDGQPVVDPNTGQPAMQLVPGIVGYDKHLATMDVDITLDTVPESPTLELEVWQELLRYSGSAGVRVTDPEFKFLIMASPLPNKTSTVERLEAIMQQAQQEAAPAQQAQQQQVQQAQALDAQHKQAKATKDLAQAHKANTEAALTEVELQRMATLNSLQQFLHQNMQQQAPR